MTTPRIDLAGHVELSIAAALEGRSQLTPEVLAVEGLSSPTVRHFLNNLCSFPGVNYLEVGTWKGSTLISASYRNTGRFTAIDNFSEFSHTHSREAFQAVRKRFEDSCRFTFHDADCWGRSLPARLPKNVNVYFYDGAHRYEDQYRAFVHYDPVFARRFIAVVDDWNSSVVRRGTRDAFATLGYRPVFEREFFTTRWIKDHWWNGIFVAVVSRPLRKPRRKGPGRSRPSSLQR